MVYSLNKINKAIKLRREGYSIREISRIHNISVDTTSRWTKNVILDQKAKQRLFDRKILGQYKSIFIRKEKKEKLINLWSKKALDDLSKIKYSPIVFKLFCSLLYWAEGSKSSTSSLSFINSDPIMISTFLKMLRSSYNLDEKKFRALVHIHEYHSDIKIKSFWSKITHIPLTQFNHSYLKPHTKKRRREDYKGSLRIRYYDAKIARELIIYYNMFSKHIGL